MTWRYGFELEGFWTDGEGKVVLPPAGLPTDGFPGLVEYRSSGGGDLEKQYLDVWNQYRKNPFDLSIDAYKFSTKEKQLIRRRGITKECDNVSNIYGRAPQDWRGYTRSSFQINISYEAYPESRDKEGRIIPARYVLFDFVPIIKALDDVFGGDIKLTNRQPGCYSIKDQCRLEYRSLSSMSFHPSMEHMTEVVNRIRKAVEEQN